MSYADKSNAELFELLFQGDYEEARGEVRQQGPSAALRVLRQRATREVFDQAVHFLDSTVALHRKRALDVLAQMGRSRTDRPLEQQVTLLAQRHLSDPDPAVVESAVYALGEEARDHVDPSILALARHPSAGVRLAVAQSLGDMPEAPGAWLELMQDPENEVRNWAAFGLGIRREHDSPEIRQGLRQRLADPYQDVRDEAVWGLALRLDPEGLRLLLERLSGEAWCTGDEQTAGDVLDRHDASAEELREGLRTLVTRLDDKLANPKGGSI